MSLDLVAAEVAVLRMQMADKLDDIEAQVTLITDNLELDEPVHTDKHDVSLTDKAAHSAHNVIKELSHEVAKLSEKVATLEAERTLWQSRRNAGDWIDNPVYVYGRSGTKYHKSEKCTSCGNSKCSPTMLPMKIAIDMEFGACQKCFPLRQAEWEVLPLSLATALANSH